MCDVPHFLGDRRGLDEELVRRVREHPARPLEVDDGVDHHVRDVHALRPDLAGDRFREDPLRGLGRRKAREGGLAAHRRGVAGGDDGALARVDHGRSEASREMQQRHRVHLEVSVQDLGIDVQEVSERAAHGVVDEDPGHAEIGADGPERPVELRLVGDVARVAARTLDLPLERGEPLAGPREHRDRIAAAREATRDGGPRAGSHPGDDGDRVRHGGASCSQNFSLKGLTSSSCVQALRSWCARNQNASAIAEGFSRSSSFACGRNWRSSGMSMPPSTLT